MNVRKRGSMAERGRQPGNDRSRGQRHETHGGRTPTAGTQPAVLPVLRRLQSTEYRRVATNGQTVIAATVLNDARKSCEHATTKPPQIRAYQRQHRLLRFSGFLRAEIVRGGLRSVPAPPLPSALSHAGDRGSARSPRPHVLIAFALAAGGVAPQKGLWSSCSPGGWGAMSAPKINGGARRGGCGGRAARAWSARGAPRRGGR